MSKYTLRAASTTAPACSALARDKRDPSQHTIADDARIVDDARRAQQFTRSRQSKRAARTFARGQRAEQESQRDLLIAMRYVVESSVKE